MEIQLALIMQLSDSTEGLHGRFGHILISSGATAVLVFCCFVSGNVIINVISWTRVLKPLHTMAHIRILLLEESYYTTNYEPYQSAALQLGVVLRSNGEGYTRGYSLHAFLCYESIIMKEVDNGANRLSRMFKAF